MDFTGVNIKGGLLQDLAFDNREPPPDPLMTLSQLKPANYA